MIFVETTTLYSDINLTLNIDSATLIRRPIYKLRVLYGQVDIPSEEYKCADLIPLRPEICHLTAIRATIRTFGQWERCPRLSHCRGTFVPTTLIPPLATAEICIREIVKTSVSDGYRPSRPNVYVFRELLGVIKLEEASIYKYTTARVLDLDRVLHCFIPEKQGVVEDNVLWRKGT